VQFLHFIIINVVEYKIVHFGLTFIVCTVYVMVNTAENAKVIITLTLIHVLQ